MKNKMMHTAKAGMLLGLVFTGVQTFAATSTNAGFDGGDSNGFTGNASFLANGGNPGGSADFFVQAFGVSLRTGGVGEPANDDFLGDYSAFSSVTISFDVQVESITNFFGGQIPAAIGVSLIDRDVTGPSGPSGVFFQMGVISADANSDWTTLSVTIDDLSSVTLPAGWIGFGDEDPNTFEPILPNGATFASVLSSVDEFQITTFVPGFFFGNSNYDLAIDNIRLEATPVPVPAAIWLLGGALVSLLRLRRS